MSAKLEIECPDELLVGLKQDAGRFAAYIKETAALALYREGRISSGLAAEWLGVPRAHFIVAAMRAGAEWLSDSAEDLRRETALL